MSWSNAGWGSDDGGWYQNKVASGGNTAEANAFLARTTYPQPGTDATNFATLINGLVNTASTSSGTGRNSLFDRLDLLAIWAGPDSTNVLQNLPNSTYTFSLANAPAFTAYRGFTGNGSNASIGSTFNPATATSPNFVRDSAHISIWVLTALAETFPMAGDNLAGSAIFPNYTGTDAYARINDGASGPGTIVDSRGFLLGNRSGPSAHQIYKNGASIATDATASSAVANSALNPMLGGTARQTAMFSSGASLSATDVTNFYNLLRAYMTAVGVP